MELRVLVLLFVCASTQKNFSIFDACMNCSLTGFRYMRVRYPFHDKDTFICNNQWDIIQTPTLVIDYAQTFDVCAHLSDRSSYIEALKHFKSLTLNETPAVASASLAFIILSKY